MVGWVGGASRESHELDCTCRRGQLGTCGKVQLVVRILDVNTTGAPPCEACNVIHLLRNTNRQDSDPALKSSTTELCYYTFQDTAEHK